MGDVSPGYYSSITCFLRERERKGITHSSKAGVFTAFNVLAESQGGGAWNWHPNVPVVLETEAPTNESGKRSVGFAVHSHVGLCKIRYKYRAWKTILTNSDANR